MNKIKILIIIVLTLIIMPNVKAHEITLSSNDRVNVGDNIEVFVNVSNDIDEWKYQFDYDTNYLELVESNLENSNQSIGTGANRNYRLLFKTLKSGITNFSISNYEAKQTINEVLTQVDTTVNTKTIRIMTEPKISYQVHAQDYGWMRIVSNGEMSGTWGESRRLEAVKIDLDKGTYNGDIIYQAHVQDYGWMQEKTSADVIGTTGQSKRVEAVKIRLTGELEETYDIYYRTHVQNIGWTGWAKNGEPSGSAGYSYRMEAIQIYLVKKGTYVGGGQAYFPMPPGISVAAHVQDYGWMAPVANNQVAGTEGQSKRVEAIKINLNNGSFSGDIVYQAHVQDYGWMPIVTSASAIGTEGQSKRIEAISINLTGELQSNYDIYYRTHVQNIGWTGWAKNGEPSGSEGYGYRMEAVQVNLVPKGTYIEQGTPFYKRGVDIEFNSHVQDIGWMANVGNDGVTGVTGMSKRMEALKINLFKGDYSGDINYQVHVQDYGWMPYKSSGQMAGTEGQSRRLEAIKIKLVGDIANYYDIYYRAHIQDIGWAGWTKNDETAGSQGYGYRMEALQIKIVKKGDPAPTLGDQAFYQKPEFIWYYESGGNHVLYNTISGHITSNGKKIIDVSEHNSKSVSINWNTVKNTDVDGVILRAGYGSFIDSKFVENLREVQRLNIPYGIYLFSYAENIAEAEAEADFVNQLISNYNINPTLGIYYDIEGWTIGNYDPNISIAAYDQIIPAFMNRLGRTAYLYTGLKYARTRLSPSMNQYIRWIAQYYNTCQYNGTYTMWQYTSDGIVSGIFGRVDLNVMF